MDFIDADDKVDDSIMCICRKARTTRFSHTPLTALVIYHYSSEIYTNIFLAVSEHYNISTGWLNQMIWTTKEIFEKDVNKMTLRALQNCNVILPRHFVRFNIS